MDCPYYFELDKKLNLVTHDCQLCGFKFCLSGCDDPHVGTTCEKYQ